MEKILFIDRDGTLVIEPPIDYQLDSFEKLEFYPGVFQGLLTIVKATDYKLVMVTNQDGLGTSSFPEDTFWPVQNFIIQTLKAEGIRFEDVFIDPSFPEDDSPNRKPGTGMLQKYIHGSYDLKNSFVIGDRDSDIELAQNLGCQSIKLGDANPSATLNAKSWTEIANFIKQQSRTATISRKTKETDIEIFLDLNGSGKTKIDTGLSFFDHMLDQLGRHGQVDLNVKVNGDLHVDEHHTIEDAGLALGSAFQKAIGSKKGIERYGFLLPMDDCLAQVGIDFGGRPWLVWNAEFKRERVGDMPTEMFHHFFKSFSDNALCNLNIKAEGTNEHHKIESIFKAWAKAIKMAIKQDDQFLLPSTKGVL
ncbi:MAG: bifunctional histidinol-phosphatase/imidazoleglycerol-phosphate dehydratase HisB [Flavobacteriales bacterium]|nr:bifunctional histidinol-phosphatase/imidazoleglycerol-phosphate dehydratase HisB [Flavobacteriales bacterium]